MAEVWLAEDTRLGRWVAVKILLARTGPEIGASLSDEARTIARLQHQNIVTVYDAGESGGRHYVVLEYVDGRSLRDLLEAQGSFSESETVRIGGQIAAALQYAHQQGILHGDVKPENILLTAQGVAKLADFGTAEALSRTVSPEQAREVLGTIAYLAPEVLQGSQATPASDVYSLGLTMYEMLAGRLPFPGSSPAAIAAQRLANPAPPLRSQVPSASAPLEQALAAAVATRPAGRPQSAGQFAGMLRDAGARPANPTSRTILPPPPPQVVTRTTQRMDTGRTRRPAPAPVSAGPNVPMLVAAGAVVIFGLGAAAVGAYILVIGGGDDDTPPTPTPTTAPATAEPAATPSATKPAATQQPTATPSPSPSPSPTATASPTQATPTPSATQASSTATQTPTSRVPTSTPGAPTATPTP